MPRPVFWVRGPSPVTAMAMASVVFPVPTLLRDERYGLHNKLEC